VVREFLNSECPRSGLDRCFASAWCWAKPCAISRERRPAQKAQRFQGLMSPDYIHMILKYLPSNEIKTSRPGYCLSPDDSGHSAGFFVRSITTRQRPMRVAFLRDLEAHLPNFASAPFLRTNERKFQPDRLFGLRKNGTKAGRHDFDRFAPIWTSRHRLNTPRSPQDNGMVERLRSHRGRVTKPSLSESV